MTFDCYFGPELTDLTYTETNPGDGIVLRLPELRADQIAEIGRRLRREAPQLRRVPVRAIVRAVDRAAELLADAGTDLGAAARTLLPATTGYSREMVDLVLTRMAADWRADALSQLIVAEFGGEAALDGFGAGARALGYDLTAHIFSGNVPGVAVTSLIRALLVKSPSFGKTAHDEPVLSVLFARALQRSAPELAAALALAHWRGGAEQLDRALVTAADLIVVYGGDPAVESIRAHCRPDQRLVTHGPKVSFGIVHAAAAHDAQVAADAARAVATFDQQGCVSPHSIFVVGAQPEDEMAFASALARALGLLDRALPRGRLSAEEAVILQRARAEAEFAGLGGADVHLVSDPDAGSTVILDRSGGFRPSCLNRTVYVQSAASINDVLDAVRPHGRLLQSVALAGFDETERAELALQLGAAGVSRITTFERLPWPPVDWHHDGSSPLRELVRFVDLEA